MEIREVTENKKQYIDLLLLADEQENMVDLYLERGKMYVLDDNGVKAECVVTDEGGGVLEIKNIAVVPAFWMRGYGRRLINLVAEKHRDAYTTLRVGTGEVPSSLTFYEKCGFTPSGRIKNFFTDNYDHIMIEDGIQLVDMVYLSMNLQKRLGSDKYEL